MAEENNLSLALENKSENPIVRADEYTVSHALQNLIDNALKYTEKGGVKIVVRNDRGKNLCVDISDTGIGISKSYLPFIFEPFSQEESGYSRRFDGNGLGLALTKKYVELNNAEISVKSEKRKGTVFTIKFIGKK
jgi:signal transduction histidine kinase